MVHVMLRRQDRDARRFEAHLEVLCRRGRQRAQIEERRPWRGDDDARGAGLQFGHALFAERPRDAHVIAIDRDVDRGVACGAAERRAAGAARLAVLFERDRQRRELAFGASAVTSSVPAWPTTRSGLSMVSAAAPRGRPRHT